MLVCSNVAVRTRNFCVPEKQVHYIVNNTRLQSSIRMQAQQMEGLAHTYHEQVEQAKRVENLRRKNQRIKNATRTNGVS